MKIERTFATRDTSLAGVVEFGEVTLEADKLPAMTFNGKSLPEASIEYLLARGLQCLQDSYAGVGGPNKTVDEAKAAFDGLMVKLAEGTVGIRTGSGVGVDPVTNEARKIMRWLIAAKDAKLYAKAFKGQPLSVVGELLDTYIDKNPAIVDEAKRVVKERAAETKKLAGLSIDI